ncbi:glutamate racemase [Polaribacter sp. P097]|uniref:glutamate racemase n=1 Tax=Polaribacter sp. P097 TaxID=3117398 RepID=UPI002FE0316F
MKANQNPIGFFDSGIGGTSIWKEVTALLPNESTIYLSDSKNAPYGTKNKDSILDLAIKNTEFLLNKNCKLIVVACNTATTNAIDYLRANYKIPFIGIEPAIKPAALKTKTKRIGILATKGTLNSALFEKTASTIDQQIIVKETIGTGLVELIEEGEIASKEMEQLLASYINPLVKENIDCLVLGCTHYPYLIPAIQKITGNQLEIIDSGQAVAKQTKAILQQHNLMHNGSASAKHEFYINKDKSVLERILSSVTSKTITETDF